MKEFFLNLLSGALENVGEVKLKEALATLNEKNRDDYEAAIHGGWALVKHLEPVVEKTKTPIDNAIVSSLRDAIVESAAQNDIVL